jgi:hypothetical protein
VARLRIIGSDASEQLVELHQHKMQIGRGRDNDVVLPDAEKGVSRVHAELRYENGHYVIVDLQSQNGTWLNGRRVERAEVPVGAEIALGEYRLTIQDDPSPVQAASTARRPRLDPIADLPIRERPVPEAFTASTSAARPSGISPWVVVAVCAVTIVIVLAGVRLVSTSRSTAASQDPPPAAAASSPLAASQSASGASATAPAAPNPPSAGRAPSQEVQEPSAEGRLPVKPSGLTAPNTQRATDLPRVGRKPGESTEAWRARAAAIQMRYGYSKAALDRGDFAAAAGGFEAILVDEPGFLNAPQLLVEAQSGLHASARSLFKAGARLDAAGDWVGALQKYEQARQIYSGTPGLSESLQRVRERLRTAGTNAFNQARQYEAGGRSQDALREYQKAIQWLPPDDPNRQLALTRVEQLRRN